MRRSLWSVIMQRAWIQQQAAAAAAAPSGGGAASACLGGSSGRFLAPMAAAAASGRALQVSAASVARPSSSSSSHHQHQLLHARRPLPLILQQTHHACRPYSAAASASASASAAEAAPDDAAADAAADGAAAAASSSSAAAEPRVRTRPRARRGSTGSAQPSTASESATDAAAPAASAARTGRAGSRQGTTSAPPDGAANHRPKALRRRATSTSSGAAAEEEASSAGAPQAPSDRRRRAAGTATAAGSRASAAASAASASSSALAPAPPPPPPSYPPPPLPLLSQAPLPAFAAEDSASYYGADAAEHYYGEESLDGGGGYGAGGPVDGFMLDAPPLPPQSPSPPPQTHYYGGNGGGGPSRAPAQHQQPYYQQQPYQQQQQQPYQPPYFDPRRGGAGGGGGYPPPRNGAGAGPRRGPSPSFSRAANNRDNDDHGAYGLPPPPPKASKRVSEMTPEERVALLLDKLREKGDIEIPLQMQRLGAHRLECPACGNGSAAEDCFAVTIRDDCALWCCHRSTCGYSGAVSVYGGYAPSEAPLSGGGGGGGGAGGAAEDEDAAAADHIRQWRAQRAREEAGGGGGGGGAAGMDGRPMVGSRSGAATASPRGFSLPGTKSPASAASTAAAAAGDGDPGAIPVARPLVPRPDLRPLTPELLDWFATRGIGPRTLRRNGVASQRRWSQQHRAEVDCIAFPYVRDGSVVNVKYRALPKAFSQTKGGEKVFYGYDDIQPSAHQQQQQQEVSGGGEGGLAAEAAPSAAAAADDASSSLSSSADPPVAWLDEPGDVIIVEGELDKLSLEEAGFRRVVSVPDGAVARVKEGPLPAAGEETKFSYLQSAWPALKAATRVLLATDNDAPGAALADELARRIGREKCWRVEWPSDRGDSLAPMAAALPPALPPPASSAVEEAGAVAEGRVAATAAGQRPDGKVEEEEDGKQAAAEEEEEGGGDAAAASAAAKPPPPTRQNPHFRKDANEVLLKDGPAALAAYVRRAQPLPIRGLFRFQAFWQQVHDLYRQGPGGLAWGASTGWPCVDPFYRVVPGELTIVTGVPNSGKSEWLDALLVNLARLHGWSFALCSMENRPADHARKLMEKYCGRPFYPPGVVSPSTAADGSSGSNSKGGKPTTLVAPSAPQRMTASELMESLVWVDERFHLIRSGDEELPSVEWVLERARAAVLRYGVRGLVIDPYNELDHRRPSHTSETEYVSQMLTRVKRFAQHYDCHVWFVAHPRQLQNWRGGAPSMYDISGSAHFINKADNGIVVHRPHAGLTAAGGAHGVAAGGGGGGGGGFGGGPDAMAAAAGPGAGDPFAVQLLVRKVRNKAAGRIGDALLRYDRPTGTYVDYDAFVSG